MANKRDARRTAERSTAYQQTPLSFGEVFRQASGEAMERWLELGEGTTREEATKSFAEIAPIATKHWTAVMDKLWKGYIEAPKGKDPIALQRELHLASVGQLNEMMKEIMGTKAFASMSGQSVESYLKAKIASDRMMEEVLRTLRIPTKTDIDDLHSSIYSLSKKVDQVLAAKATARPAAERRR